MNAESDTPAAFLKSPRPAITLAQRKCGYSPLISVNGDVLTMLACLRLPAQNAHTSHRHAEAPDCADDQQFFGNRSTPNASRTRFSTKTLLQRSLETAGSQPRQWTDAPASSKDVIALKRRKKPSSSSLDLATGSTNGFVRAFSVACGIGRRTPFVCWWGRTGGPGSGFP